MADWRASLSFIDRFTTVSDIQQALRGADSAKSDDEVNMAGQSIEDSVYQSSTSKDDYSSQIRSKIESLNAAKSSESQTTSQIPDPIPAIEAKLSSTSGEEKISFGPYKDAIYHTNGTSSTVYIARAPISSPTLIALKVTTPSTQPEPHNSLLEAKILQSLIPHKSIIQLLSAHTHHETLILTFPFLPFSLCTILQSTNYTLPDSRKKEILKDLFSGLDFLHTNGIIHRDIKPSNILLANPLTGPAQIIDFGTAYTPLGSESPAKKCLDVETTCYRSPELLFGCQNYGTALDMWAAGCVAAEVLVSAQKRGRKAGEETGLFEAGDLGSELRLVKSIFETLGTPTEESWPSSKDCPDWGKMTFKSYPAQPLEDIYPGASEDEIDFLSRLVRIESTERMTAAAALQHRFLSS